ncbi:5-hydroxytryptamine receptor 3A-like [Sphaerodactylus townsendi]|uniref:5-hydroxytryptamine receptor 3A-like n=1 Tax=Sphaerodactylus townsendi TaxID=933632 RepID=UPI0020275B07|nr:5-hydroxytryptamine receptor 3A-like [Sphaerodactylus townsendi]
MIVNSKVGEEAGEEEIWNNEFVSWNPSDFCNITRISLPVNLFWMPDVYIDERADEDKFTSSPYVDLSYNGTVCAFQVYRLTSTCNLDVHAFPFDEQKCNLTLMSSMHSDKQILMKNIKSSKKTNQDSRENYLIKGEWKFEKLSIVEETIPYKMNFSTVTYEISMKRRSIFHVLVLIVPTFTLFLLDTAISFTVVSPGDMIAFKVTLILETSVLSLILNEMLPATSDDPPVIVMYFTGIFMFMVLGILENFLMMYLNEKKPTFLFFKDRKCMSRFWRKKTVDPVIIPAGNVTDETSMENKQINEGTLPETDNANSLVLLKRLSVELQQIRKHLVLEGHQDEPVLQDKTFYRK